MKKKCQRSVSLRECACLRDLKQVECERGFKRGRQGVLEGVMKARGGRRVNADPRVKGRCGTMRRQGREAVET